MITIAQLPGRRRRVRQIDDPHTKAGVARRQERLPRPDGVVIDLSAFRSTLQMKGARTGRGLASEGSYMQVGIDIEDGRRVTVAALLAMPATISVAEADAALGIGHTLGKRLRAEGDYPVPVLRLGRSRRVSTAHLMSYLGIDALHAGFRARLVTETGKDSASGIEARWKSAG